jgi:hypothetical protein
MEPFPFSIPPFRILVKRVLAMTALWMVFGLVVGSTLLGGNLIGVLSGAIAGGIVLPWLGMCLGLMGGPAKDSLFGAVAGSAVAMLYTSMRAGAIDSFTVNLCLVMGGIIGANFAVFLALRKRLRAKRLALTH